MVTFVTSTVENDEKVFFSKDDDYYQPTEAIHVSKNALSRRMELMDCSLFSYFGPFSLFFTHFSVKIAF